MNLRRTFLATTQDRQKVQFKVVWLQEPGQEEPPAGYPQWPLARRKT